MGLFSGGNSKSTTNNTAYNIANYGAANGGPTQTVAGITASGKNSAVTLNTSDYGAVQGGLQLAQNALDTAVSAVSNSQQGFASALSSIAQAQQTPDAAGAQQTFVKLALIAVAGIAIIVWVRK
ncbi:MAG TPA: hypothetical protein VFM56_10600 [Solimonas sp.]|nr:hypothetical protein [Solimonas sp.]